MPKQDIEKTLRVLRTIKSHYMSSTMTERILRTQVISKPLPRGKQRDILEEEDTARKIYERYNIPYFKTKEEFIKRNSEYNYVVEKDGKQFIKTKELPITDKQLEALWEYHSKRHKLIMSGQYEEIREEMYKENYATGLRRLGATQQELDQIMSLTHTDLLKLLNEGGASKEATSKYALPEVGLFSYDDVSQLAEVRNRIKTAFQTILGRDFIYDETETSEYLKKIRRFVPREEIEELEEEDNLSYYSLIDNFDTSRIKLKETKTGSYYYVPFLGSERGKNSDLIKDIVSRKKRLGEL